MFLYFFFNDTATTEIYTLSLHDALPILKWKNKNIKVYFVTNLKVSGFSDPLTIKMSEDHIKIAKTLTHEAVHEILLQNPEKWQEIYEKLNIKFPKENIKTKVHIIVNAITEKVFSKVFDGEESKRIMDIEKKYIGLKRAYELLENMEVKDDVIKSILEIGRASCRERV